MFNLPAKTPAESKLVTFDFANEAATETTLSSPTVAKALISGGDAGAAALNIGAASVVGRTVQAMISAGIDGSTYRLTCTAAASNGEVHQITALLPVSVDAA